MVSPSIAMAGVVISLSYCYNKKMSIKAVLFDMGKVLIRFDFDPAFRKLAPLCKKTPRQVQDFFSESGLEVLYDGGKISSLDFHRQVRRGLGHSLDFEQFRDIWNGIFTPVPGMAALARRLAKTHRLVLVSNTNAMHFEHVKKHYSVLDVFDRHVLSFKEKVRKPDPRIYRTALKACRAKPHEVLYIDDREDLTQAARELGLHVHTFKNDRKKLEGVLKKHGAL